MPKLNRSSTILNHNNKLATDYIRQLELANARLELELAEQKQAETALHRSEELYRTLILNFPNGSVILFDHDLRSSIVGGEALAAVSLSEAALEGKTVAESLPLETAAELEPHYRAALAGDVQSFELPIADRIFAVQSIPVRNEAEEIVAGMAVIQDIMAAKRAEALLRESEEWFRLAFEAAAVGMGLVTLDGDWMQVNGALCAIIGYSEAELLRTNSQALTHPDDLEADLAYMRQLVAGKIRFYHLGHGSNQLDSSAITPPAPPAARQALLPKRGRASRADSPARPTNRSVPPPCRSTVRDWRLGARRG